MILEPHGKPGVFEWYQNYEGPDDKWENSEYIIFRRFYEDDDDREGINRACAYVSEYEPHSLDNILPFFPWIQKFHLFFLYYHYPVYILFEKIIWIETANWIIKS